MCVSKNLKHALPGSHVSKPGIHQPLPLLLRAAWSRGWWKEPSSTPLWPWSGSCTWGYNLQHTGVAITVCAAGYVNVFVCVTCVFVLNERYLLIFCWWWTRNLCVCELFIMSLSDTCCREQTGGELCISRLDKMLQYCSSQLRFTESLNKNKISWWRLTWVHLQPPV